MDPPTDASHLAPAEKNAIPRIRQAFYWGVLCVVAGALVLPLDKPVSQFCMEDRLPGDVRKLLDLSEIFAHGIGVAMIGIAIFVLDPARRRFLPRVLCCAFGAGLIANLLKFTIGRTRPHAFGFDADIATSFGPWFPAFNTDDWGHAMQSLPSGHTATAIGLAVGLAWLYPHGRWLFVAMVVLAAGQRVETGNHWLSDTLFAGAVALPFALQCVNGSWLSRWFDRKEQTLWRWRRSARNHCQRLAP